MEAENHQVSEEAEAERRDRKYLKIQNIKNFFKFV